jgi:type III restriction enzyme
MARNDKDSPEKRRKDNLISLKHVDETASPVEWIVSVSMLTEGWDVKNVFQIVPHESRAFSSKLLIAQVLGRGLRVPPQLSKPPFVTINNHEAWSVNIGNLLQEVLEVENTLTWGYDPARGMYAFPLHNLRYEPEQKVVEVKREQAKEPDVQFMPQERKTTEYAKFSQTGTLAVEIEHFDRLDIADAVRLMRLFLREKNEKIAAVWTKAKLEALIVGKLTAAGQDPSFLSKGNLLRLQQGFGPMFRELDKEHPRMSQVAKDIVSVDLKTFSRQSFSESALKEHGGMWVAKEERAPYVGTELALWDQYQLFRKQFAEYREIASDQAKAIGPRIHDVAADKFKLPWNVLYVTHEPERKFSELLFENATLFDSIAKMPNMGGYSFPYSYKPARAAKTHVANENFNPDFFLKVAGKQHILVVEIKDDGDDSNQNSAKCRDGLKHFETLNTRLAELGEPWKYFFYFLSPDDYTKFFAQVRAVSYDGWRSGLMQTLSAGSS